MNGGIAYTRGDDVLAATPVRADSTVLTLPAGLWRDAVTSEREQEAIVLDRPRLLLLDSA